MNKLDPRISKVLAASTLFHSKLLNVSFDTYRDLRYRLLSKFVTQRHLVYLDMNFWIGMAAPSSTEHAKLLSCLRAGVANGTLLCPISFTHFSELKKQDQADGRQLRVARLMDELSLGVSLRNPNDIERIEFLLFFLKFVPRLERYVDTVWCPTGHLLSESYPYDDGLPEAFMELGRKVMCDVHWNMSIEYLATRLDWPTFGKKAAAQINQYRLDYKRGNQSFRKLLTDELVGVLEVVETHIDEIIMKMREAQFSSAELECMEKQRKTALNSLVQEAIRPKFSVVVSQRVHAALHAERRMDDSQMFDENDLDDLRHGATAAAYCDSLFCERHLAHLLRTPRVAEFCLRLKVIATNPTTALEELRKLGVDRK